MIFQKKVRAGILLYALLMMGIFALLLQFYLQGQVAIYKGSSARQTEAQAYLMASLTRDHVAQESVDKNSKPDDKSSGQVEFKNGRSHYQQTSAGLQVSVHIHSGESYSYQFPVSNKK